MGFQLAAHQGQAFQIIVFAQRAMPHRAVPGIAGLAQRGAQYLCMARQGQTDDLALLQVLQQLWIDLRVVLGEPLRVLFTQAVGVPQYALAR